MNATQLLRAEAPKVGLRCSLFAYGRAQSLRGAAPHGGIVPVWGEDGFFAALRMTLLKLCLRCRSDRCRFWETIAKNV